MYRVRRRELPSLGSARTVLEATLVLALQTSVRRPEGPPLAPAQLIGENREVRVPSARHVDHLRSVGEAAMRNDE